MAQWSRPGGFALYALAALALVILASHGALFVDQGDHRAYVAASLGSGAVYAGIVAWMLCRGAPRGHLAAILIVGTLLRGLALTASPGLSSDHHRYVWDGRLQQAGINPYLHVPADERLAHMRDGETYPNINQRERAYTIYPPAAQLVFRLGVQLGDGLTGQRRAMLLCELVAVLALLALLRRLGRPREHILIYAWHPLPVFELAGQAHIDAALLAPISLAVLAALVRRQALAGALLGVAILVKLYPVVLAPALWRRWDWRMPAAAALTALALYLPFWSGAGNKVIGFLGSHLDNEGYGAGWGFAAIWLLRDFAIADPPLVLYALFCLLVLGALTLRVLMRPEPDVVTPRHLLVLAASFTALSSPHYPWYLVWLVPLLTLAMSPAVLALTLLAPVLYWPLSGGTSWTPHYLLLYGPPAIIAAAGLALSRSRSLGRDSLSSRRPATRDARGWSERSR